MSEYAVKKEAEYYEDLWDHINDELELLDLRIKLFFECNKNAEDSDCKGLFSLPQEIEQLFEDTDTYKKSEKLIKLAHQITELENNVISRASFGLQHGIYLPLYMLSIIMGLSRFEYYCVITCLAAEIGLKYHSIFGFINNDLTKFPTVNVVMQLMGISSIALGDIYDMFRRDKALAKYLLSSTLQEVWDVNSFLSKPLKLDERIIGYILGSQETDKRLYSMTSIIDSNAFNTPYAINYDIQRKLKLLAREHLSQKESLVFYLWGKDDYYKLAEVKEFCRGMGKPLFLVDLKGLIDNLSIDEVIRLMEREVLLTQSILCIKDFDVIMEADFPALKAAEILRLLDSLTGIVFLMGKIEWRYLRLNRQYRFLEIFIKGGVKNEGKLLWQNIAKLYKFEKEIDWDLIASKYHFNEEQIKAVFEDAWTRALYNFREGIAEEDLFHVCSFQMQHGMGGEIQKIRPIYGFKDIILPNEQKQLLKSLCSQMKYRNVVYSEWGFDKKLSYGKGINAVFSGPPGTGKTMAAQVVAYELGMELYRIDLSQVLSKYIGETEKNLHRIFEDAQKCNAILFFDEADALFGKRSEVKDSKDRYANMEISYLLQKVEEYESITIMATNLCENMDEAFKRRIQFIIDFPFPNAEYRKKIWEAFFPKEAPLGKDIEFNFLAEAFEVSGGNIKNIAVMAAFNAAGMSSEIRMEHIIDAAKYELKKIGKIFSNEKVAMYMWQK